MRGKVYLQFSVHHKLLEFRSSRADGGAGHLPRDDGSGAGADPHSGGSDAGAVSEHDGSGTGAFDSPRMSCRLTACAPAWRFLRGRN